MRRNLYILGAFGKISNSLLISKIQALSSDYQKIFLIDVAFPSQSLCEVLPTNSTHVNLDVKSWLAGFMPEDSSDFILTIGKDYPYTEFSSLPECVFYNDYDDFTTDFYLNVGYVYDILSKCEQASVKDMTFISYDSIYSEVPPNRSLYGGRIKPIIYGLGKAQLSLIAQSVRQNFHQDQWQFYNLRLGAVSEVGLSSEFMEKYKSIMCCVDTTSIYSVIETTYFLLSSRPISLSGSTLNLTSRMS
jgi:hypothetical protein